MELLLESNLLCLVVLLFFPCVTFIKVAVAASGVSFFHNILYSICSKSLTKPLRNPRRDPSDLFEVVEGSEDDIVTSSHQTHGCQQLQHQSFGPEKEIYINILGISLVLSLHPHLYFYSSTCSYFIV